MRGWRVGEPVLDGRARTRSSSGRAAAVTRVRAYFVRSPRLPVAPANAARARGRAADHHARRLGRERVDPPRGAVLRATALHLAIVHHTAGSNSYTRRSRRRSCGRSSSTTCRATAGTTSATTSSSTSTARSSRAGTAASTRPVIGAHAQGFNTGSVGVALIGNYSSTSITPAARAALVSLLAWRLDVAHVDPLSKVVRVSAGQPALRGGHGGHAARDLGPPRRLPDRAARARASTRSCPRSRSRGREDRAAEALRAGRGRAARRAGPLHGAALERRRRGR